MTPVIANWLLPSSNLRSSNKLTSYQSMLRLGGVHISLFRVNGQIMTLSLHQLTTADLEKEL